MIKRQRRIARIGAVLQEYLAAKTASDLLIAQTKANPSYGLDQGWEPRAGIAFTDNLEATYVIRIYAEFEAALRDYWLTYRGQTTRPKMYQLVNQAIPDQAFSQDVIDNADDVLEFRNYLVHDIEDEPGENIIIFTVPQAKSHLCAYLGAWTLGGAEASLTDQIDTTLSPAPNDVATCMFYTGIDPFSKQAVYIARNLRDRKLQRALLQFFKPENYFEVRKALEQAGRADLIGNGCEALIPAQPPKEALQARRDEANETTRGEFVHAMPKRGYRPGRKTAQRQVRRESSEPEA